MGVTPTGMHAKEIPTVEAIFTISTLEENSVKAAIRQRWSRRRGLLLLRPFWSWLEVEITSDGAVYRQRLKMVKPATTLKKIAPQHTQD